MVDEILTAPAHELARRIVNREQSSEEITRAHLDRIAAVDGAVRAFVSVDAQRAIEQAKAIDEQVAAGVDLSPLAGVPIAVKDLFCYQGLPTTASSKMLADWYPPYDSTVVKRLQEAGMVILGLSLIHISEPTRLLSISYAVFCLKKKKGV